MSFVVLWGIIVYEVWEKVGIRVLFRGEITVVGIKVVECRWR